MPSLLVSLERSRLKTLSRSVTPDIAKLNTKYQMSKLEL